MRTIALLFVLFVPGTVIAQDASGDAENGEKLFLSYACYTCHGYNGTGMTPLSRYTSGVLSRPDVFLIYMRLRGELNPMNPSRSMPHYGKEVMSDEQAMDLYAYLVSLDDEPPELDEIPAFVEILDDARQRTDGDADIE